MKQIQREKELTWKWYTPLFWRLLKRSGVFRYWYKDYMSKLLSEVYYNMEIADLKQQDLMKKWHKRVKKVQKGKFIQPYD